MVRGRAYFYIGVMTKKDVWVRAVPWQKKLVTTALESGADAIIVEKDDVEKVRQLGRILVVSPGEDIEPDRDFITYRIKSPADLEEIARISKTKRVIVETADWHVIPLENLVAQTDNIMVSVRTVEEASMALNVLEIGVRGIIVESEDLKEVKEILKLAKSRTWRVELCTAAVKSVRPLWMGDRVCVDTCSEIEPGAGLLVGNSSSCMFLVHAENIENPYVTPRPFRVNAGALHAYVMLPGGKTGYLSELKAGDEVVVVNSRGEASVTVVGRVKMEKRPLLLVEVENNGERFGHIVQNAETIRFVRQDGLPISVVNLCEGDEIVVYREKGGRHFGMKIEETIKEK